MNHVHMGGVDGNANPSRLYFGKPILDVLPSILASMYLTSCVA